MIFHIFLLTLLGFTQTTWCADGAASGGGRRRSTTTESSESDSSPRTSATSEQSSLHGESSERVPELIHTEETDFVYFPISQCWDLRQTLTHKVLRIFEGRNHWDASRQKFLPVRFDGHNPTQLLTDLTGAITAATPEQRAIIFGKLHNFIREGQRKEIFGKIAPTTLSSLKTLLAAQKIVAENELKEAQTRLESITAFQSAIPKDEEK